VGDLPENLDYSWNYNCTDKVVLLRFVLNKQKTSVYGVEFGCINAFVVMHPVRENLVLIEENIVT
jgi:hypothetical protein